MTVAGESGPSSGGYRPLDTPAAWTKGLLWLSVAASVAVIAVTGVELSLFERIADGGFVSDDELQASDRRIEAAALAELAVLVASVIAFLTWFRRAYSNLPALGAAGLRYRSWWAIGAWFIPIWNLFRPKQLANDVWRASDPNLPPLAGDGWRGGRVPALLGWWWGLWLFSGFLGSLGYRASAAADTLDEVRAADSLSVTAELCGIVAALLAIRVVSRATARQRERAGRLATAEATAGGTRAVRPLAPPPLSAWQRETVALQLDAARDAAQSDDLDAAADLLRAVIEQASAAADVEKLQEAADLAADLNEQARAPKTAVRFDDLRRAALAAIDPA